MWYSYVPSELPTAGRQSKQFRAHAIRDEFREWVSDLVLMNSSEVNLRYRLLTGKNEICDSLQKWVIIKQFWIPGKNRIYELVFSQNKYYILKSPSKIKAIWDMVLVLETEFIDVAKKKFKDLKKSKTQKT